MQESPKARKQGSVKAINNSLASSELRIFIFLGNNN
jgi:hypothetical protein